MLAVICVYQIWQSKAIARFQGENFQTPMEQIGI